MKIGIYGGSFNPIHFGHLGLARWVTEHDYVDELWLMVTPNNPLKDSHVLAPEQERYVQACQAVQREGLSRVRVSDVEFSLPRPNFTAQTLRHLQAMYPQDEFVLVIGEDNWHLFSRWRDYQWILANFSILIYPRHTQYQLSTINSLHGVTFLSDAPYFDISSTALRAARQ